MNLVQSPGGSHTMSDSSPSVICASASCLVSPTQALHRNAQGKEAGVAPWINTERCPGNCCLHEINACDGAQIPAQELLSLGQHWKHRR